tara:strand:+ start:106 stop:783 length:678 start_codon:yes stop_codon:yes gene_type:complete
MMIFYVGDIHGKVDDVAAIDRAAIDAGVDIIVQVGDFGIHWNEGCAIARYFKTREQGPTWYTCGGNHDNWDLWQSLQESQDSNSVELAPGCFYVVRGQVVNLEGVNHIFFGGAESTDKRMRREGVSWWAAETPSREEFNTFFENMETARPEVVITHDAPLCIKIDRLDRDTNPTPRNLQNVLDYCDHTPVRWYFGHHHMLESWEVDGVKFSCCGLHGQYISSEES